MDWRETRRRGLGGAVSPALAVLAMTWVGWRGAFILFGAIGLIWVAVFARWYRDDPAVHHAANAAELEAIRVGAALPPAMSEPLPGKQLPFSRDLLLLCAT